MTVPAQVLAAVRSIPHPRQEPDMTTIDKTGASDAEFQARVDRFDVAPPAPESFDAVAALRRVEELAERLGDESREFYYDNRHTHENGINYVSGMSDGMEQIAARILAAIAAPH